MNLFKHVIAWLKLTPANYFSIMVFCSLMLFLPAEMLESFGVTSLAKSWRPAWALGLLAGAAFWLPSVLLTLWKLLCDKLDSRAKKGEQKKHADQRMLSLQALTDAEKSILRPFIKKKTKTQQISCQSGVVNGLVAKAILFRSSEFFEMDDNAELVSDFNIADSIFEYLTVHPEVLQ